MRVTGHGSRAHWKEGLVGVKGRVEEIKPLSDKGNIVLVGDLMPGDPIWFAEDCLESAVEDDTDD